MTNYVETYIIMFCTLIYHHQERQFYLFFMLLDDIGKDKGLNFFFYNDTIINTTNVLNLIMQGNPKVT